MIWWCVCFPSRRAMTRPLVIETPVTRIVLLPTLPFRIFFDDFWLSWWWLRRIATSVNNPEMGRHKRLSKMRRAFFGRCRWKNGWCASMALRNFAQPFRNSVLFSSVDIHEYKTCEVGSNRELFLNSQLRHEVFLDLENQGLVLVWCSNARLMQAIEIILGNSNRIV